MGGISNLFSLSSAACVARVVHPLDERGCGYGPHAHGFIQRHTVEVHMDKIESVDVDQTVLGRILDYGDVTIRGTGTMLEPIREVDRPIAFRNEVTAR